MRKLIYIPVVHTQADMGSLQPAVRREFLGKYRASDWQTHSQAIHEFWQGLTDRVTGLQLDYQRTCVYQDGLPVCGKERQIVADLAEQGSQNHRLVLTLLERGAALVGTESPKLLLDEYQLLQQVFSAPEGEQRDAAVAAYRQRAGELLAERDDYIRHRIVATLPDGGIGVLFIGLTHQADQGLPNDMQVTYLIHNLPFTRANDIKQV